MSRSGSYTRAAHEERGMSEIAQTTGAVTAAEMAQLAMGLIDPGQKPALQLAVVDQKVLERQEAGQVRVVEHERDVIRADRLPGVQTDQDIAALEPGPGRRALRVD